jgi:hypothetical protein
MTEEINKDCEFQSDCIEYKDISYLKIMPICAIHELSIACHNKVNKCKYYELYKQLKRLEQELKWANDEEKYLKDCCIKAGKELEKHSFKWDGKEKNLVVQALQLNQLYEKLEQENKELKIVKEQLKKWNDENLKRQDDMQLWIDLAEEQRRKYRSALEEIRELAEKSIEISYNLEVNSMLYDIKHKINEVLND